MIRIAAIVIASAALNVATGSAQAVRPADSVVAARVDEYMSRLADDQYSGGVVVVHDGKVIIEKSYGLANRADKIPADVNTVYNLGSITKQFTAAAILRLEELHKLHTTDSIFRFFPGAPPDKRNITIHQLLTHTAGFDSDFSRTDYEPTTRAEYMSRMLASKLRTPPGAEHCYANSGYSMLAAIVEIVTGKEYEVALRNLVLEPARMLETGYTSPHWDAKRLAHGYQGSQHWGTIVERISAPGQPYWELRGNGGLGTTLGDMVKWDAALNDRRILTDSSRRKFMTGYVNEGPQGLSQYAYGWAVMKTSRGTRLVTHNGGNGIFVAELLRFVDEGTMIFLASTNSEMKATPVVAVVSRIVFGAPYELPARRGSVAAGTLAKIAGKYVLPNGDNLTLRADETGNIVADPVGQSAYALLRSADTASPARAKALNAKSLAIVEALVKGDVKPLVAAVDGGQPVAQTQEQESQMLANRKQRFGELKSIDVLGTVRGDPGLITTVRLNFERGAATNIYEWDAADHIADVRAQPYQSTVLTPVSDEEFVVARATGNALHLKRRGNDLVAPTPRGDVLLKRVP